jgi:hypothetical protein
MGVDDIQLSFQGKPAHGSDVLFEQNGSRITDFRRGKRLGPRDHVVAWPKPARPQWMTPEEYCAFPDQLQVRETPAPINRSWSRP